MCTTKKENTNTEVHTMTYSERIHAAADFIAARTSIRPQVGVQAE